MDLIVSKETLGGQMYSFCMDWMLEEHIQLLKLSMNDYYEIKIIHYSNDE